MSCQADLNIHAAMKAVSQALRLDSGDRQLVCQLLCTQHILIAFFLAPEFPVRPQGTGKTNVVCCPLIYRSILIQKKRTLQFVNLKIDNELCFSCPCHRVTGV